MFSPSLREFDLIRVGEDKARSGKIAFGWLSFCSELNLTLEEIEALARKDKKLARLVSLYKQKCKASILQALLRDPRNLSKYGELTYAKENQGGSEEWESLSTIK